MKVIYSHCKFVEDCDKEDDAQAFVTMWKSVIDLLSTKHKLFIRAEPQYEKNNKFEENVPCWTAYVRFSIGPVL